MAFQRMHTASTPATVLMMALLVVFDCTVAAAGDEAAFTFLRKAPFGEAVLLGHMEDGGITEASGMAASRRNPGVLWIVNDSGDDPALYAVDLRGTLLGRLRIRNARNIDWEDLAAFGAGSSATLLVADVGDNHSRRKENELYFVREPDIRQAPQRFDVSADWYRRVRFVYEDGPRDCEAVAVDPKRNQILLMTKRTVPPVIYTLPLNEEGKTPLTVARRYGVARHLQPPADAPAMVNARFEKWRSQPTAMDISPDGSEIAVLTYGDGYLYRRPSHLDWSQVFRHPPQWIRLPPLRQAEAICFFEQGQALIVTSEKLPAPLYRLNRY